MVENYLNALKALGLVEYDPEEQLYESTQAKKRVFRSKHDYDLALKHSKNLVLSTNEKQRLDGMDPFLALDLIVFHDDPNREDEDNVDDKCLFQHLITGYSSICLSIKRYHQLMDETSLSKMQGNPKFHFSEFSLKAYLEEKPDKSRKFGRKNIRTKEIVASEVLTLDPEGYLKELGMKPEIGVIELKEINNLKNDLVGKIYSLVYDVKNGIPLDGYCNHCPDKKLTINE